MNHQNKLGQDMLSFEGTVRITGHEEFPKHQNADNMAHLSGMRPADALKKSNWIENPLQPVASKRLTHVLWKQMAVAPPRNGKKTEDQEKRYQVIIDNILHIYFEADMDGNFLEISPSADGISPNYDRSSLFGKSIYNLFSVPSDRAFIRNELRVNGRIRNLEIIVDLKGKPSRYYLLNINVIYENGGTPWKIAGSAQEITAQKMAEEALRQSEKKLRHLSSHLLKAQEEERKRLAFELHDELGQSLTVLKLQLRSIQKQLSQDQDTLTGECQEAIDYIGQIIKYVRNVSRDLTPPSVEDLGISTVLHSMINSFKKHSTIHFQMDIDEIDDVIPSSTQILIYRILQEALTNIQKHSEASQVLVSIKIVDTMIVCSVEDDGKGFDSQDVGFEGQVDSGIGLTAMAERVRLLGSRLKIETRKGKGTRIHFQFPINQKDLLDERLSHHVGRRPCHFAKRDQKNN